ncbi:hypothetical protein FOA52_004131 [Chlamydomonas sp. UWO 241]|nr:hypothetical protein FOA52_004131 [Chlamydomonas sp. UWO 241]
MSETVVKCSLKRLLVAPPDIKEAIVKAVEKRVVQCSIRTQNATVALNLLVRQLFDGCADPLIPEFWDTTFVRQLLLGTDGAHKPVAEITQLFKDNPLLAPIEERSLADSNIYTYAAKKLATNISNHLVINIQKVVKRYLYDGAGLTTADAVQAQFLIYGWDLTKKKKKDKKNEVVDEEAVKRVVADVRKQLGLADDQKIGTMWYKSKPNLAPMLRMFVFANRALERAGKKLFNILPICRFKAHFITIDKTSVVGILNDAKFGRGEKVTLEKLDWRAFLGADKLAGKNCTFTTTIDTDGLAINVHFTRPKNEGHSSEVEKPSLEGKRVLACDPGRSNIMYVVEKLDDGRFEPHKLTRRQYYAESGIFKANENSARWNKGVIDKLEKLSTASPKSVDLGAFSLYVNAIASVRDALWEEYLRKRWREQTFRLYGGKKRSFAKFFNGLKLTPDTVLAYGASKFASGGKGELSVPVSRAYKECRARVRTFNVCEFRTTAVHWRDDTVLQTVVKSSGDGGRPVPPSTGRGSSEN